MIPLSGEMQKIRQKNETDWDDYYSHPFPVSRLTKRLTAVRVLSMLRKCGIGQNPAVAELGGGNSFFFPYCDRCYRPADYLVIDRNRTGIQIFQRHYADCGNARAICADLAEHELEHIQADLVLSFGLIEHFTQQQLPCILEKHFRIAHPGGIVVITFPTPRFPYGLIRTCAEHLGLWKFPDERPLEMREVQPLCERYGRLLQFRINRMALLTQAITVWQAN